MRRAAVWVSIAALAGCASSAPRPEPPDRGREPPPPAPSPADDPAPVLPTGALELGIGLSVGVDAASVMSTAGLRLVDGETGELIDGTGEEIFRFERADGGARVTEPARLATTRRRFAIEPLDREASITVDGVEYRGGAEVLFEPGRGLVIVNRLSLEAYLLGVVPVEIGRRSPEEFEAVKAQAVAARTYAISNIGRRDSLGFDLFGSVEDQAYGGLGVERAEVERAVLETAGEIMTFDGEPILAAYHSTCGGRTATREEVWAQPDLPYLRSVDDRAPDGDAFCQISPRYRWRESWDAAALDGHVRTQLAAWLELSPAEIGSIRGVRVLSRTVDDRVDELEVVATRGRWVLRKNRIRFILRPAENRILGSTDFRVVQGRIEDGDVVVEGGGFGHGIGMCQWGAIARARAGQSYRQILRRYYTGVQIEQIY